METIFLKGSDLSFANHEILNLPSANNIRASKKREFAFNFTALKDA